MKTLKGLRTEAKLTLNALSGAIGVSIPFLHEVETGKKALPERLIGPLSEVLGVSESDVRRACPPLLIRIADLPPAERAAIAAIVDAIRADVRARCSA